MFIKYLFLVYDKRDYEKCGEFFNCPVKMLEIATMHQYRKRVLPDIATRFAGTTALVTRAIISSKGSAVSEKFYAEYDLEGQNED